MHSEGCDPWLNGETTWTLNWKAAFYPAIVDIVVLQDHGKHLADVQTESQVTIKFWPVLLPPDDQPLIEDFFGAKMIWIINGRNSGIKLESQGGTEASIFLPYAVTDSQWTKSARPLFFDTGSELVYFESGADIATCSGMCIDKDRFLKKYNRSKISGADGHYKGLS